MRNTSLLLFTALAFCASAQAETLSVHKANAKPQNISFPVHGQTSTQVVKQFGEPRLRHAPVGGGSPKQPPITRWDYESFSVFFDAGTVIDTVVKDQPPEIAHKDELQPGAPVRVVAPAPDEPLPVAEEPAHAPSELMPPR